MRAILFDLGKTLIDDEDRLLPGALQLLEAVRELRGLEGRPVQSGLVSDWETAESPSDVAPLREEYYDILRSVGLDGFFQPLAQRVTLSTEVGSFKPDVAVFREALDRLEPDLPFHDALFVTENPSHIAAARLLGLTALHFKGPGQVTGDFEQLTDLIALLHRMVAFPSCCERHGKAPARKAGVANQNKQADPATTALVARVDPDRLRRRIQALEDFGTRWALGTESDKVTEWLRGEFLRMGYPPADVRFQPFAMPGAPPQRNVLCGAGAGHSGFVLLCAHYDSLSETPAVQAPGADDNASGVAVLLEAAELLSTVPLRRGLLFAAFGGEEQGLYGSAACAEVAEAENWRIDVVVNLDMIAWQDAAQPNGVIVEYDQGQRHPGNDAAAKAFGLQMAQVAADYTRLEVEHTDIWNSDYLPFEGKGLPMHRSL